jgi:tetratricopeptide (TPR) repeat protein
LGMQGKLPSQALNGRKLALRLGIGGAALAALLGLSGQFGPAEAADKNRPAAASQAIDPLAPESPIQVAYSLYQLGQYAASADTYEAAFKITRPEPRLYYYAALANQQCGRTARAAQLFQYIVTAFPTAPEAASSRTALGAAKASTAAATLAAVSSAATQARAAAEQPKPHAKGARAFTPAEIAKEGANAIDQSQYPNCWFEASMSALAQLPRGQVMLSNMIHYGDGDKYVVRFPGDGVEYLVSVDDAMEAGITNRALWASLLECAQIRKFPNNQGAGGVYDDKSRLDVGMGCVTGGKAEEILVHGTSPAELSSFIGGALKSQSPIIAGTYPTEMMSQYPRLVVGPHAYTIIGLDPARNMVTLRNPHGAHSQRFTLPSDPQHLQFEQMGDGIFKMNLELFPNYFYSMARSFI